MLSKLSSLFVLILWATTPIHAITVNNNCNDTMNVTFRAMEQTQHCKGSGTGNRSIEIEPGKHDVASELDVVFNEGCFYNLSGSLKNKSVLVRASDRLEKNNVVTCTISGNWCVCVK